MFETMHPKQFCLKFLEASVRPCGRGLSSVRKTNVTRGTLKFADGSSVARVGGTTIACGLKLEVGIPEATKPAEGRIAVDVNLSPLCSTKFTIGKQCEEAVAQGARLAAFVNGSSLFDPTQLCIEENKSVWVIYADLVCLNHDGNLGDASMLALIAALQNLRIPRTELQEDGEVVQIETREKATTKLKLAYTPIPLSFAVLDKYVLSDPNAAEEALSTGSATFVYTPQGELCHVNKPGGTGLSVKQMRRCMELAKSRAKGLASVMQPTLPINDTLS